MFPPLWPWRIGKFFFRRWGHDLTWWPDLGWPGPKIFRKVAEQLSEQLCKKKIRGCSLFPPPPSPSLAQIKGSMPPRIGHMELLARMQGADFSEHIQRFKPHGNPLNSSPFDAPNTKFAPTGYRRAPNIILQHYKQESSAKASIIPKDRPIRFR